MVPGQNELRSAVGSGFQWDNMKDGLVKSPAGPVFVIPAPFCNGVNSSRNPFISIGSGLRFSPE